VPLYTPVSARGPVVLRRKWTGFGTVCGPISQNCRASSVRCRLDSEQNPPSVQDVRVDGYDATASFVGRAPPVVLSELELGLLDATDDPSDTGQRLAVWSEDPARPPQDRPTSVVSLIGHGAVMVLLAIPVLFAVAVGIAAASR
jgi:hypothetical protein